MTRALPLYCRPEAYALFESHVPALESSDGLLGAAVAVAKHDIPSVDAASAAAELDRYAADVRERVRSGSPLALLAHAHQVLFEERGFCGNIADYENPYNSYLPLVLQSRRGLPITLCLIYKLVLERLGLRVVGLNAPMHFMAGVELDGEWLIIDPFHGGRMLRADEAARWLERMAGTALPGGADPLPVATHRQWLERMIVNLLNVFRARRRPRDFAAMLEFRSLLT